MTLMRKITTIWILNQIPADPAEYDIQSEHVEASDDPIQGGLPDAPSRQLNQRQEREIVDSISFLSATSDDPLNVMAVGLEEDLSGNGVALRFASNTGQRSKFEKEMRRLAELLMIVSRQGLCP